MNLFYATVCFYAAGIHQRASTFLILSGGTERGQWNEID